MWLNLLAYIVLALVTFAYLHYFFYKKAQLFKINKAYQKAIRWNSQSKPVAGGITFFISFIFGTTFFLLSQKIDTQLKSEYLSISLALIFAFFTGLADDMLSISPQLKLLLQAFAAFILVYSGLHVHLFEQTWLNFLFTMIWYIGIMNSINMLDNMDTVATSIALVITSGFLVLNLYYFKNLYELFILISLWLSLATFLIFNIHPSKMYMGDNGSLFLGLLLAIFAVKYLWNFNGFESYTNTFQFLLTFFVNTLFFLIPLTDTTTVTINRIFQKRSPFTGGRDHTTHALYFLGLSENQIAIMLSIFNLISVVFVILFLLVAYNHQWLYALSFFYSIFVVLFLYINATIRNKKNKNHKTNPKPR